MSRSQFNRLYDRKENDRYFLDSGTEQKDLHFKMKIEKKRAFLTVGLYLFISAWLSGCALAPGMTFDANDPVSPDEADSVPVVVPVTRSLVLREAMARQAKDQQEIDVALTFSGGKQTYRIGASDTLSIIVWDHPELVLPNITYTTGTTAANSSATAFVGTAPAVGYLVDGDGNIQVPYVGVMHVAGLTEGQVREQLTQKFASYVKSPQLTVRVIGYNSRRVFVDGEVKSGGVVAITDIPMTLSTALNAVGGISSTGDRSRVTILRSGRRYRIDIPMLSSRGISPDSIYLKDGDTVTVGTREDSKVTVTGEVTRPTTVEVRGNGRLSLSDALGEVGGVAQLSGGAQSIYIMRVDPDQSETKIFHLDAKSASALVLAQQFQLNPSDVIFVDSTGLVKFSRIIGLITGSASVVYTGQRISNNNN